MSSRGSQGPSKLPTTRFYIFPLFALSNSVSATVVECLCRQFPAKRKSN